MNLEIHKAELVQRVNAHIQSGPFHDADELIERALDALDEKTPAPVSAAERRRARAERVLWSCPSRFAVSLQMKTLTGCCAATGPLAVRSISDEPGFPP
jgi:hypothetical protein